MSNEEFLRRKATKNEQVSVPPDGFYVCGCGASLWILVKNGDCVCAGCNRAQARIKVSELAPVDYRPAPETRDDLWNPHGNDGMRHMESADVTGGATDMTGRCTHGTKHTDGDGCPHCPR